MKKGKVVIESGRAYAEKHKKAELDRLCPECQCPGAYRGRVEKGFLKRDEYIVYGCECRTKWMVFEKRKKFSLKEIKVSEFLIPPLTVAAIVIGVLGFSCMFSGFLIAGLLCLLIAILLFLFLSKVTIDTL